MDRRSTIKNRNKSKFIANWSFRVLIFMHILSMDPMVVFAQVADVVVTRRANSEETIKRNGTIVEWKGSSLTLENNGRRKEIPNESIVEVQTGWNGSHLKGNELLEKGLANEALARYQKAMQEELRPWVKRMISAQLVKVYLMLEQPASAAKQFLLILNEDPDTRFLKLSPLNWAETGTANPELAKFAQSDTPSIQLLGASWLLSVDREKAIRVLTELTTDLDPRIRAMATAQLWRTRTQVNEKQISVWQSNLAKMPRQIRAGPLLVLATTQARSGLREAATLNFMKVRILYPDQQSLAAAALFRAAKLFRQQNDLQAADSLVDELKRVYPQSLWAQQAN
ncbi:MAG: hypothetical protein AAF623_11830 [Planctomycetota bacterium]